MSHFFKSCIFKPVIFFNVIIIEYFVRCYFTQIGLLVSKLWLDATVHS